MGVVGFLDELCWDIFRNLNAYHGGRSGGHIMHL